LLVGLALMMGLTWGNALAAPRFQEGEGEEGGANFFCATPTAAHPVGARLAGLYGLSYEEVMGWFCEGGHGFGQIMLALRTAEALDGIPDDYLERRAEGEGWGRIWRGEGLIGRNGRPEGAGPLELENEDRGHGGPPAHAGPKDKERGNGPPDHAGPPAHAGPKWDNPGNGNGRGRSKP
jgi:hypothetical protein